MRTARQLRRGTNDGQTFRRLLAGIRGSALVVAAAACVVPAAGSSAGPAQPPAPSGCTVKGTPRGDVLRGRPGVNEVLCGLGGADAIYAGPGDTVWGGPGADTIYARNRSPNAIFGGPGVDRARVDRRLDQVAAVERFF
jgi:hypothetical protein